jgi:hypothetical protein
MADVYRFKTDVYHGTENYKVYTQSGIDTGDMCQWDTGARLATANLLASGSIFLGVAESTQPLAGLGSTTVPLTGDVVRIKSQGVFEMKTTTGETYSHLEPVFQGADAQTVTKVSATRLIGRIHLPDGTQVTGAAGTSVKVRIFGSMTNVSTVASSAAAAQ